MMNLRRTRAIARKEFLHIVRDARSLLASLALPFLLLILNGYALTLDVDRIPTAIYDLDRSPESRALIERFLASRYFNITEVVHDYAPIEDSIDRNRILLAIVIHKDYSRNLLARREAAVQLLFDGSDSNTAAIAQGYAEGVIRTQLYGTAVPPVEARAHVLYNSSLKSRNYIVPGLISVILMIIGSLVTSMTIAREWENGTMEQLLATPLRPAELLMGKLAAYFTLGVVDMVIAVVAGVFVFKVPLTGSGILLFSTSGLFLFGVLCWGLYLSAATRSQVQAYQLAVLSSFLPAFFLSGFIYAIENMPVVIQLFTYLSPTRYFVTILKGVFLKGQGIAVLWPQIVFLLVYASVLFVLAIRALRRKMV